MDINEYVSVAKTTKIVATSRAAIKVHDNFYTVEYTEERSVQADDPRVNMDKERQMLFDTVNNLVDLQCEDIINTFQKK